MSLITKNNYEAFLLDYVEGNLSPELTAELMLFFENHPELKEVFDDLEFPKLNPESLTLKEKERLKVEEGKINHINFEEAVIAEIEGENSKKEQAALYTFLKQNPDKKEVLTAYKRTKLVATATIFEDKALLKQDERKVIPLYWWFSAAAAVILALFLLNGINWNNKAKVLPITEKTNPVPNNKNKSEIENTFNETTIKENFIANKEQESINVKVPKPKKIEQQKNSSVNQHQNKKPQVIEQKEEYILANELELKEIKIDSSELNNKNPQIEVTNDDLLYADANNVKIIYDDEPQFQDTSTLKNSTNKVSKFRILKEVFTHKLKDKMIEEKTNDDGEVVAQAFNIGPFNISRKRK